MFQNIPLGTYIPGHSLLHRLQARTKLLVIFWLAIFFTVANRNFWHFIPYTGAALLLCLSIAFSSISPGVVWRRMRWLLLLALIGIVPSVLFYSASGAATLGALGPWPIPYGLLREVLVVYGIALALFILLCRLPISAVRAMKRRRWYKVTRLLLILLALAAAILLWVTRDMPANAALPVGPILITYDGVWVEVTVFVVFLLLFAFSLLLTMTTTPIALIEGLTRLLTPLRWLRLPVDDFALMTLIALRFIPTLLEEMETLVKAQTARGADFSHGSLRERMHSVTALFLPFMHNTFRRASDLAIALDARGFQTQGRQTMLHETAFSATDYLVMGAVALITIGAFVI